MVSDLHKHVYQKYFSEALFKNHTYIVFIFTVTTYMLTYTTSFLMLCIFLFSFFISQGLKTFMTSLHFSGHQDLSAIVI